MGSSISGLIAEAILQKLEGLLFAVIAPKFGKGYVDETFVIIKKDQVPSLNELLSTILPGEEFIMEKPTNDRISFLDVLIQKLPSGDFEKSVYHKETNADVVLHFGSNHPAYHIRRCVRGLFDRVDTHCISEARRQKKTCLYRLFSDNVFNVPQTMQQVLVKQYDKV